MIGVSTAVCLQRMWRAWSGWLDSPRAAARRVLARTPRGFNGAVSGMKATEPTAKLRRRRPKANRRWLLASESEDAPYFSKSLARALDVVELFPGDQGSLSLREIARRLDQPESSIYRVLFTLERRRYLVRDDDGSFRPAPRLAAGRLLEGAESLRRVVHPQLEQLSRRFDETVTLAVLFENRIEVVDVLEGFQESRVTQSRGKLVPPHCSSLGKTIMAFQVQPVVDRIIQSYGLSRRTDRTIVDRISLMAEFERVRQCGYAVDREEAIPGATCFGAPILDAEGRAVGSISISLPSVRVTDQREREIVEAIREAGRRASEAARSRR